MVYKGSTSFKAQTNYNSSYSGRYHAMKTKNNAHRIGDTGFYGFAFYLQSAWDFQPQQYQLFQFIGNSPGPAATPGCRPQWSGSTTTS